MDMPDAEASGAAAFLFEQGLLKLTPRTGWLHAQVRQPESIAEHSHRTAVIASVLAAMEGADPARAALLGAFHDSQETRIGDIPHNAKRYLTATPNQQVTADQVAACPPVVADMIADAVAEYEAQTTLAAHVAKDADKLECLFQAIEYQRSGNRNVQPWIDSSRAALKTSSARRIADAALKMTGLEWRND